MTAPDNPSGYCPRPGEIRRLAEKLPGDCLLVVDEAYIHFAAEEGETEADWSLLRQKDVPANVAFIRTFSKCYGLAGLRIGVGILPEFLAGYYWRPACLSPSTFSPRKPRSRLLMTTCSGRRRLRPCGRGVKN